MAGIVKAEVDWKYLHPRRGVGVSFDELEMHTDVCLLEQHTDQPVDSYDNATELKKLLAIRAGDLKPNGPNRIVIMDARPLCNCTIVQDACDYAEYEDSLRFKKAPSTIDGFTSIWQNEPGREPTLVVGRVMNKYVDEVIDMIRRKEGHK